MAIDKVRAYFKKLNMEGRILEFDVSSATVELAAEAIGCAPEKIVKTMSFLVADRAVLIAMAGDARISNPKFKEFFHTKAKMIPFDEVERYVGHAAGGVCPFALPAAVEVYLDISLQRFDTVYPAAGSSNSAVRLTVSELAACCNMKSWVDVCKDWE